MFSYVTLTISEELKVSHKNDLPEILKILEEWKKAES